MNKKYNPPALLKGLARERLAGNFGVTVRAYIWSRVIMVLIAWLTMSVSLSDTGGRVFYVVVYVISLMISGIFDAGSAFLYLHIINGRKAYPGMIFYCFRHHTDRSVLLTAYLCVLETLYSLLFAVSYILYGTSGQTGYLGLMIIGAGIMFAGYLLVHALYLPMYYLMHDFPDYSAAEIIRLCPKLTMVNIGRLVSLYISLIPLKLLGILSLGVGAPWVESYISAIESEYYMDLMNPVKAVSDPEPSYHDGVNY